MRGSSFTRGFFFNPAAEGVRGSSFTRGFFLTAQPKACAVLVLHGFFFFFFFFSFVGDQTQTSARPKAGWDI